MIAYVRRCGEVAEAVSMSSSPRAGAALVVPLAARSRSVVTVAEEEWQM